MKTLWLTLCLLNLAGLCRADRDIVYAARYYAPPGSHQTSHFHLYRINPNGTGKTQLTFGFDEEEPHWSADGKRITFLAYSTNSDVATLCEIDADGRNRRVLRTVGKDENLPDPVTPGYRLENINLSADTDTETCTLVTLRTGRRLLLTVPDPAVGSDVLLPMPGGSLVYAVNHQNSTSHTNYFFYRINAATGKLRYLTEGQFLAWSPDGSHFCVAPCRDTTSYEKRKPPLAIDPSDPAEYRSAAENRKVWFAPLYVRAAGGGKMTQITPRLSYVTGADWRRGR